MIVWNISGLAIIAMQRSLAGFDDRAASLLLRFNGIDGGIPIKIGTLSPCGRWVLTTSAPLPDIRRVSDWARDQSFDRRPGQGIQVRNVISPSLGRSVVIFTNDDTVDFGEVWQGHGLSHDLLSAAFCAPSKLSTSTRSHHMKGRPMTIRLLVCILALATAVPGQAQDHGASLLNGGSTLDLWPTNEAPAYIESMTLDISPAGVVRGEFYDHPIEDGRSFNGKGRTCFAFHTSDNTGPYRT